METNKGNLVKVTFEKEMERKIAVYTYLKEQGLTLDEIIFLLKESCPLNTIITS